MNHSHVDLNALAAFADGRLPEPERAALIEHLAACGECRATLAVVARGRAAPATTGWQSWVGLAAVLTLALTVGVLVWRPDRVEPTVSPPPPTATPPVSADVPDATGPLPASPQPTPPVVEDLGTRRSGARQIGTKTFRLVAGEWIDAAYDPLALLPVEDASGSDARARLLARVPALAKYASLGPKVVVVHDNVVYRFRP